MPDTIQDITPKEVHNLKTQNTDCQIIDVREVQEYEAVRIPGSKLISLSTFDQNYKQIDETKPAYFLCSIGKRALKAAEYLSSLGYKDLYVIEGGIKAWIEAGYPVDVYT